MDEAIERIDLMHPMRNLAIDKALPVVGRFLKMCCCFPKVDQKLQAQKTLRRKETLRALVSVCCSLIIQDENAKEMKISMEEAGKENLITDSEHIQKEVRYNELNIKY